MLKYLIIVMLSLIMFTGCAFVSSPVNGGIVTNVTIPVAVTASKNAAKEGRASCHSILGIVAYGDCSIEAAKQNGAISEVSSVSYNAFSVLSFYSKYETIVKGN